MPDEQSGGESPYKERRRGEGGDDDSVDELR